LVVGTNRLMTRQAVLPTVGTDSPLLSAVFVAMGGARGIIFEVLWWRISELQRQDRYAEVMPLTDLLVTLDPASPDTWVYNSWNLAYNVSAAHHDDADRWHWVKQGVELLERGLRITPKATPILRQLGWTFEDKIGRDSDYSAPYYRNHLSELAPPADTVLFATRLGIVPDWNNAQIRALYWYDRASDVTGQLRVMVGMLAENPQRDLMPYFLSTASANWDRLLERQQTQIYGFLQHLNKTHPQWTEVAAFLQEKSL
jgi:hypothetical protein